MTNEEKEKCIRPWIDPEEPSYGAFSRCLRLKHHRDGLHGSIGGPLDRDIRAIHAATHLHSPKPC